ncbi:MAG: ATP-binding cassette domain-containing protein [Cellvibrionaceae bacterium]|nr:ATP-binding cassette domain-containing protein [Cellvibrionaceae bacterium]
MALEHTATAAYLPIVFTHVHLTLGDKPCLQDINARISSSGITAISGPNGAGKTLLLKLLGGLLQPTQGALRWQHRPRPPAITWVPQQAVLVNNTVEHNIRLPLKKTRQPAINSRSQAALQWADIGHLAKENALRLSSGEKQLVALARAWALAPRVLLLDEPCANLDKERQQQINTLIQAMHHSGCKIFLSSHDPQQINTLATDVMQLHCGKLVAYTSTTPGMTFPDNPIQR